MRVTTDMIPYKDKEFYLAEDHHQKHTLQRYPDLFHEYRAIYPDMQDLIASTAAARVNGYLAGYGECNRLESEIESLGLSSNGMKGLLSIICRKKDIFPCVGSECVK